MFSVLNTQAQFLSSAIKTLDSTNLGYNRAGFTLIFLSDPQSPYRSEVESAFKAFRIPERFDNNGISSSIITRPQGFNLMSGRGLNELLVQNQVHTQLVKKLFNEKDGQFNYEELYRRARYTMNDNAVLRLKMSSQGVESHAKTDAWILPLIANTYLGLLEVKSVKRWKEVYDEEDERNRDRARRDRRYKYEPVRRSRDGYAVEVATAVYRVNLRDTVLYKFWDNYWIDAKTPPAQVAAKKAALDKLELPIVKETATINPSDGSSGIGHSYSDIPSVGMAITKACTGLMEDAVSDIEALRTKTVVYDVWPIRAKLGTKEGVYPDKVFAVYDRVQNAQGVVEPQLQGHVRASVKVTDNRSNSDGTTMPTEFYQISGKRLEQGMVMVEEPTGNLALQMGWVQGARPYLGLRIEGLTRGFFSEKRFWNNSRLYLDLQLSGQSHSGAAKELSVAEAGASNSSGVTKRVNAPTGLTIIGLTLGVSKYFNFFRNVQTGPHLGIRGDLVQFSDNNLNEAMKSVRGDLYGFAGITLDAGWRLQIHVWKGLRVSGGYAFAPNWFRESSFFARKISTSVTENQRNQLGLNDPAVSAVYGAAGTDNPFFVDISNTRWETGIHFEF